MKRSTVTTSLRPTRSPAELAISVLKAVLIAVVVVGMAGRAHAEEKKNPLSTVNKATGHAQKNLENVQQAGANVSGTVDQTNRTIQQGKETVNKAVTGMKNLFGLGKPKPAAAAVQAPVAPAASVPSAASQPAAPGAAATTTPVAPDAEESVGQGAAGESTPTEGPGVVIAPAVKPMMECEDAQGTVGQTVTLTCTVLSPSGAPVKGVTVYFSVHEHATWNVLGFAKSDARGVASLPYTIDHTFTGRTSTVVLNYNAEIRAGSLKVLPGSAEGHVLAHR